MNTQREILARRLHETATRLRDENRDMSVTQSVRLAAIEIGLENEVCEAGDSEPN